MAEVGTGNSVDVNFRVLQTSFDAKGETGANINTQTADVHDNLDPSLTLALFSEKHPEMCPIFTVTTENFQALQAAQNDGIFISPTTLTLAQGLHESYVQIKNPSDRVLLSDFVTALGFPEFAYEIIVQCRMNYEELTSWDRERQNVITVQGTVNEMTSADPNPKQVKVRSLQILISLVRLISVSTYCYTQLSVMESVLLTTEVELFQGSLEQN